jgi:hypothetical protein
MDHHARDVRLAVERARVREEHISFNLPFADLVPLPSHRNVRSHATTEVVALLTTTDYY